MSPALKEDLNPFSRVFLEISRFPSQFLHRLATGPTEEQEVLGKVRAVAVLEAFSCKVEQVSVQQIVSHHCLAVCGGISVYLKTSDT